ncbi:late competence development ComFB family protein [Floridanema evergladense]|uniref:Late competence development ComFB family protein n=1 Tax=Floridaenema evergladense BLCC-F167 TaxID=3153639 RepID=A0ABV4WY39_9CYAN
MTALNPRNYKSVSPESENLFGRKTDSANLKNQSLNYINVLEAIVIEEVERQMEKLSPHLAQYINPEQAIAYALNRLPSLYATSEEGWRRQQIKAKTELKNQIKMAVRQGLAAVQKDPLKVTTPLKIRGNLEIASHNLESNNRYQQRKYLLR